MSCVKLSHIFVREIAENFTKTTLECMVNGESVGKCILAVGESDNLIMNVTST
jgi:hypothetical protein